MKKIYTDEEAKERKRASQREYAKRKGYDKQAEYLKENTKRITFKLFTPTEDDIIAHLETKDNKAGYIKDLIRADMEKNKP